MNNCGRDTLSRSASLYGSLRSQRRKKKEERRMVVARQSLALYNYPSADFVGTSPDKGRR